MNFASNKIVLLVRAILEALVHPGANRPIVFSVQFSVYSGQSLTYRSIERLGYVGYRVLGSVDISILQG